MGFTKKFQNFSKTIIRPNCAIFDAQDAWNEMYSSLYLAQMTVTFVLVRFAKFRAIWEFLSWRKDAWKWRFSQLWSFFIWLKKTGRKTGDVASIIWSMCDIKTTSNDNHVVVVVSVCCWASNERSTAVSASSNCPAVSSTSWETKEVDWSRAPWWLFFFFRMRSISIILGTEYSPRYIPAWSLARRANLYVCSSPWKQSYPLSERQHKENEWRKRLTKGVDTLRKSFFLVRSSVV